MPIGRKVTELGIYFRGKTNEDACNVEKKKIKLKVS